MVDNTKVNHYEDQLFEAFDVIIDNRLKDIKFDQTVKCTIEDNTDKKNGKYRVKDPNGLTFDAYSEKTDYAKGVVVYVTIPQGDYTGQKIIVGFASGENAEKPYTYVSPFDQFFGLTENLFQKTSDSDNSGKGSLLANDKIDEQDSEKKDIISQLISGEEGTIVQIMKANNLEIAGQKVIAVKADFQTLIPDAVEGNYGLILQLTLNSGEILYKTFNIEDMFGNPYNYAVPYTQEKVFDISDIQYTITGIDIYFAQVANTFKNAKGEALPYTAEDGTKLANNLNVSNLYVAAGIMVADKTEEYLQIYVKNQPANDVNLGYDSEENNKKTLGLRWVHIDKNGKAFNMETESAQKRFPNFEIRWYRYEVGAQASDEFCSTYWKEIDKFEVISVDSKNEESNKKLNVNETFSKFQIRDDDNVSDNPEKGVSCKKYRVSHNEEEVYYNIVLKNLYYNEKYQSYYLYELADATQAPLKHTNYSYWRLNNENKEQLQTGLINSINLNLYTNNQYLEKTTLNNKMELRLFVKQHQFFEKKVELDLAKKIEKFKVIAFIDGVPYRSEVFEFENGLAVEEQITKLLNPLTIVVEDGSNGNYLLYGQNRRLLNTDASNKTKFLSCYFNPTPENGALGEKITDLNNIRWSFPLKDSMIIPKINTVGNADTDKIVQDANGNKLSISYQPTETRPAAYAIDNHWDPSKINNTVTCKYMAGGVTYYASKEFTFGFNGTMGTEQTLIIDFVGNTRAVNMAKDKETGKFITETIKFKIQVYDLEGKEQEYGDSFEPVWKWMGESSNITSYIDKEENEERPSNELWIKTSSIASSMNTLKILECSVGDLTTYFPVPLCSNTSTYGHIDGPTEVIYGADGYPFYDKGQYNLYETKKWEPMSNIKWKIILQEDANNKDPFIGIITEKNILIPYSIYVEDATIYGVQAFNATAGQPTPLWTQPILVIRNKWPSATINSWDGSSIQSNAANGKILAKGFAAGKKESDNSFTGVVLGQWEGKENNEDSISKNTGIYGFHKGGMSYAFKDDGTAFIGKSGIGRILFDGGQNKGIIESANYSLIENNQAEDLTGLQLDFANGKITLAKESEWILEDGKTAREIKTIKLNTQPGNNEYPFEIGNNFSVDWNGRMYANKAKIGGEIEATSGSFGKVLIIEEDKEVRLKGDIVIGEYVETIENKQIITKGSLTFELGEYNSATQAIAKLMSEKNNDGVYGLTIQANTIADYDEKEEIPIFGCGLNINPNEVQVFGDPNNMNGGSRLVCDAKHIGMSIDATPLDQAEAKKEQTYITCYPNRIEIGTTNNNNSAAGNNILPAGVIDFLNNKITNVRIQFG